MTSSSRNLLLVFLQGLTGAGIFLRLDYPGAPREFIDSLSLDEIQASREIDETCAQFSDAKPDASPSI